MDRNMPHGMMSIGAGSSENLLPRAYQSVGPERCKWTAEQPGPCIIQADIHERQNRLSILGHQIPTFSTCSRAAHPLNRIRGGGAVGLYDVMHFPSLSRHCRQSTSLRVSR